MGSNSEELLEAFRKATNELKLCPNRVWAVAGENLPKLLPNLDGNGIHVHQNKHELCTFDFCEYSRRDFTAIQQRHECEERRCTRLRYRFPRRILEAAARNGTSTVWNLSGNAILKPRRPYMAVSHVWSDGTGTGAWPDGEVNECLYLFFRGIAEQFQCEGIWWDTLCIPREKAARTEAIRRIQSNYQDARITLVHDLFLRNWEWDPKTACFAILMSPWFSRGWTALELARSPKVKVIFKGCSGPVIKDLDEEILAKGDEDKEDEDKEDEDKEDEDKEDEEDEDERCRKRASQIIRNLRKEIRSLNELLTVLGPRYTSWPKDLSTISALLVDVEPGELQQNTYMRILNKIEDISAGHLFHNAATMSTGFSWCPTSLFYMPLDNSPKAWLKITDNGIRGMWRIVPVDETLEKNCLWNGSHPLIKRKLQDTLKKYPEQCRLLAECGTGQVGRALLVREMQEARRIHEPLRCQYVGALYFRQELKAEKVDEVVIVHSGMRHLKREEQSISTPESKESEVLRGAVWRRDSAAFKELVGKADLNEADELGRRPLHLAAERGQKQMVEVLVQSKIDINVRCDNGQTALHRAAWGGSATVVELLLRNRIDEMARDKDGNAALHIAAQMGYASVAKLLIRKSTINMGGCNNLTPLHFAAMGGHRSVVKLLKDANVEAKDNKIGWTPLHCAADNGDQELVRLLMERGADVNTKDDQVGWTPLHFAAMNGHKAVVNLLLRKGANITTKDNYDWIPRQFAEINGHKEVVELLYSKDNGSADAISANGDCWTSLHCKAINNEQGIVKLLVDNSADVYFNDKDKSWTPLRFAAENELGIAIRRLLEKGANALANDCQTPMHRGNWRWNEALARLLLETGADKESKDSDSRTPLHQAAFHGYVEVTRLLLGAGTNKEAKDSSSKTPLHHAVEHEHEDVARLLLEAGANKEAKDSRGQTPLHLAAFDGREEIACMLLEAGANKEAKDSDGCTPLQLAAERGHEEVTRLLLEAGTDKEAKDLRRPAPLHLAAEHGHEEVTRLLLEAGANMEAKDPRGQTPLHLAIEHGHEEVTRLLLEAGADKEPKPTNQTPLHLVTWHGYADLRRQAPLHLAAEHGHEAIARLLLEAGANNEAKDSSGKAPLHLAASRGHEEVTRLLLEAGANKEAKDPCGWTPLNLAIGRRHEEVTRLLLEAGANQEAKDPCGWTPLHSAAWDGHEAIARLLLEAGANKEAKNSNGEAPLHLAAGRGHEEVTRLVLEAGANKEAKSRIDQTPLHLAAERGHEVTARLLHEAGANKEAKDRRGQTPLNLATEGGHEAVARLLR